MKSAIFKVISAILLGFSCINVSSASLEDNSIEQELNKQNTQEINVDFSLKTFDSCKDMEDVMGDYVKDYWEENWKNRPQYSYYKRFGGDMIMENSIDFQESEAVMDDAVSVKSTSSIAGSSNDFSETNTQVKGVDESDIVKTDGKFAYYYNSKDKYVYIVDLSDKDDLQVVKKIKIPKNFYSPVLYIDDNRLVVVSGGYSKSNYKNNYWYSRNQKTYTIVFDTSDIKNPKLIKMYASEGNFRKSRKIGDYLYVLSNNSFDIPYYTFRSEKDIQFNSNDIIPKSVELTKIDNSDNQNLKIKDKKYPYKFKAGKAVECDEISYALPGKDTLKKFDFSPSYNVISVININDVEENVNTDVIAGNNAEIFMSQDNLYLTSYMYQNYDFRCPRGMFCSMPFYSRGENTLLHKINVDKNELTYQDSTIVPGQPLTQYSMDEYGGKFRIITQKYYPERETGVYVLDDDLSLLGSLGGLGKTEDFKSSRFMGDKLFLVTFKQIDPFYVVDMSTDQPKVMGELKIPGYSTYLHPYDENHIIGLGYNITENKWGGTMNDGIKIDVYEIDYDRKPEKSLTWEAEELRLLEGGCTDIQFDVDGNTCSINEDKTGYDQGCTEMLTTQKLDLPKCIGGNFQENLGDIYVAQKFTKTLGGNGSYSEALKNPRMFMWNAAKNTLLLPAQLYVNSPDDHYKRIDFYQGLFAYEIDKDTGISEKYRVSHIDFSDIEKQRSEECGKYSQKQEESNCKLLLDGTQYCSNKKYSYVPKYCFADSNIGEYKASKSYNYRNDYVKRSLWIGDTAISISDNKIMTTDLESGKKYDTVNLK